MRTLQPAAARPHPARDGAGVVLPACNELLDDVRYGRPASTSADVTVLPPQAISGVYIRLNPPHLAESNLLDEQGRSEAAIDSLRRALGPPRSTSTRCLISRCCFSETTGMQRRRSVGGVIWPATLYPNGQHGRGVR